MMLRGILEHNGVLGGILGHNRVQRGMLGHKGEGNSRRVEKIVLRRFIIFILYQI
jgi:hypothetical protein